jgi:hypothetical protein
MRDDVRTHAANNAVSTRSAGTDWLHSRTNGVLVGPDCKIVGGLPQREDRIPRRRQLAHGKNLPIPNQFGMSTRNAIVPRGA